MRAHNISLLYFQQCHSVFIRNKVHIRISRDQYQICCKGSCDDEGIRSFYFPPIASLLTLYRGSFSCDSGINMDHMLGGKHSLRY